MNNLTTDNTQNGSSNFQKQTFYNRTYAAICHESLNANNQRLLYECVKINSGISQALFLAVLSLYFCSWNILEKRYHTDASDQPFRVENVSWLPQAKRASGQRNKFFFREMSISNQGSQCCLFSERKRLFWFEIDKMFFWNWGILVLKPSCFVLRVRRRA